MSNVGLTNLDTVENLYLLISNYASKNEANPI